MIRKRISIVPLAAVVAALGAPAASAVPAEQFIPRPIGGEQEQAVAPVRVVQVRSDEGFDITDAGIGAAAMLALTAMGSGVALLTARRGRGAAGPTGVAR